MLLPPSYAIITYEQLILHDIIRGTILCKFREELAKHHGTDTAKEVFDRVDFDVMEIRDLYNQIAQSYCIDPKLINFPMAITKYLDFDIINTWQLEHDDIMNRIEDPTPMPYVAPWGCIDTVENYNRYLILQAAKEVGGDVRKLFVETCRKLEIPAADYYDTCFDLFVPSVLPKFYRKHVLIAKSLIK